LMVRSNGVKTETSAQELPTISDEDTVTIENSPEPVEDVQDIDDILNSLKTLLSSLEKLQKVRQEVGDIKPLIGRMLDGELVAGEELEQLKTGVSSLSRLVRAYNDHQIALAKAQPARNLLDQVLKERKAN
jgi:DNA repair ATPase RecN